MPDLTEQHLDALIQAEIAGHIAATLRKYGQAWEGAQRAANDLGERVNALSRQIAESADVPTEVTR